MSTNPAYIRISGNDTIYNKLGIENEIINTFSRFDSNLAIFTASNSDNANILLYNKNKNNLITLSSSNNTFSIISNNNKLITLSPNETIFYSTNTFVNNINLNSINTNSNITVNTFNDIDYLNINTSLSNIIKANTNNFLLLKGNLGIGTTNPKKTLDVTGDINLNYAYLNRLYSQNNNGNYININDNFQGKKTITLNAETIYIPNNLFAPNFTIGSVNVDTSISTNQYSTNLFTSNANATQLFLNNNSIASKSNINGNIINIINSNILPFTSNQNSNIINIYTYTSNENRILGLQPTLILDKYGQMIFGSNNTARGIIDINYNSNYPSSNILYFNTSNNNIIIDNNANIGIYTSRPIHPIHINNNSNIKYTSLIGLYNSNIDTPYFTANSNSIIVANLSSKGNLTLGNIPNTDNFNIDVTSNIRTPSLFTNNINTINNNNINFNANNLSNLQSIFVNSNIQTSNLNTNNINTTSITANNFTTNFINIANLTINDKVFNVSSSNQFISGASNILFSPLTTLDNFNIPVNNQKLLITPNSGFTGSQFIGLNITSENLVNSIRISGSRKSIYESYLYNYQNQSLLRYCQIGIINDNIISPLDADCPFQIIYGNTPNPDPNSINTVPTFKITNNYSQFYDYIRFNNNNNIRIVNFSVFNGNSKLGNNLNGIDNLPTYNLHSVGSVGFANSYISFPTFYYSGLIQSGVTSYDWVGIGYTNANINLSGTYKFLVNGKSSFSDIIYSQANIGIGTNSIQALLHVHGTTLLNGGNVGINTTIAQKTLDVNGDINFNGKLFNNQLPYIGSQWTSSTFTGFTNDIYYLPNNIIGNVGIGTTNTSHRLNVNGTANFNSNITVSGTVSAGNIASTSDIKFKENIEIIHNALDKIKLLSGYYYNRIDLPNNPKECGCIAQEVQKVIPELVYNNNDNLSISYGNMSAIFIEAFKDINNRLENIEKYLNIK